MKENSIRTEVIAGITTFLTMSYIIFVNPLILSSDGTGMSFSAVMTGTILASFVATLLMGLIAKLPFALAPGMGLNAFFTYTLILDQKIPWQQALGLVFWSGVVFVILSVTPFREKLVKSIPKNLRMAMAVGIGIFLAFIGLKNTGIIIDHPVTLVQTAPLSSEGTAVILGFVLIIALFKKNIPGSLLIGILFTWTLGALFGKSTLPKSFFANPDFSYFMQADIIGALKIAYIPSILTLMMTDLFDSLSTFIGVAETANLKNEKGEIKNMKQALTVDALATLFSAFFGTSTTTTFVESSAGVSVGGRTGLTSIITAICFLPFLFLAPFAQSIPSYATAPVLIFVGILMFKNITSINFEKFEEMIPAFLCIVLIPLSFSITTGIMWGLFVHTILYIVAGRIKDISLTECLLSIVACLYIIFH
ncbi:NCS2 family permease [Halobacteriovorax sp. ZH4_bin.1]|uniref:NCS2 family permease n=1 Tax=unclassified Halobacteriovorax TaxID=2639665 RepID=UPI00371F23ED